MGLMSRLVRALGAWVGLIAMLVVGIVLADLARLALHDARIRLAEAERLETLAAETDRDLAAASEDAARARADLDVARSDWNDSVPQDVRTRLAEAEVALDDMRGRAARFATEYEGLIRSELDPQAAAAERLGERTRLACTGLAAVATCGWASMREEAALLALARAEIAIRERLAPLAERAEEAQSRLDEATAGRDQLLGLTLPPAERVEAWSALEHEASEAEASVQTLSAERESLREQQRLLDLESGLTDRVVATWRVQGLRLAGLAAFILAIPYLRRAAVWGMLAPLLERAQAVQLLVPDADGEASSSGSAGDVRVTLEPGQQLFVRSGFLLREEGRPRTKFVHGGWRHPFTSIAAGLLELEWFTAGDTPLRLTLGNTADPDSQLLRVDLVDHPGFVVHPAEVVALTGGLRLERRWRLLHLHAWLTWQLRYVLVAGTGSVFLEGGGHVLAEDASTAGRPRVPQGNVLGFDGRLTYRCLRSRPFWSVLLGRRGMWDDSFTGDHLFVVARTDLGDGRPRSALGRAWRSLWGVAERALGIG